MKRTNIPFKHLKLLLTKNLKQVSVSQTSEIQQIKSFWRDIVGVQIEKMCEPYHFENQVLFIQVKNSSLLMHLKVYEKKNVLKSLQKFFPHLKLNDLLFTMSHCR